MSDVFISYARKSAQVEAQRLRDALSAANIDVFLDEEGIPPGSPFPTRIADAILQARVMMVFADQTYFSRPWCVYEFQVGVAPYQAGGQAKSPLSHMVIALPSSGNPDQIVAHFPPPLAQLSWPRADQTEDLVKVISERLAIVADPMAVVLKNLDNEAVKSLRSGALVPPPAKPHSGANYLGSMPPSLKGEFVGRTEVLWEVFNALETKGAADASHSCSIQGSAGMGKTQIAAEYVSRYGPTQYPGGIVWIDAGGDDADLVSQFNGVLVAFSDQTTESKVGASTAEQLAAVTGLIRDLFRAQPADPPILWVVDNVPEPLKGKPPAKLSRWCPARDYVSLLCTSRHAGIKDVDKVISLAELSLAGAVEFLTRAPVKKSWLASEQWEQIAVWIGCWPLGLRILHTSLGEAFITPEKLAAKARGAEPAAALDAEVEALRDEVFEGYLHGVAEVFHVSYESLSALPEARLGAHVMARLARTSVPESLLDELFQDHELGILAKRSWIQATEESAAGGGRRWGMHRVAASYLRGVSLDAEPEFAKLIDWFAQLFRSQRDWAELEQMTRHIRVVSLALAEWLHFNPNSKLQTWARDLAIALATWNLPAGESRSFRFLAAQFADAVGAGDELANTLEQRWANSDVETARNISHVLSALPSSDAAAALLIKAISDSRDLVRWTAFVDAGSSSRGDLLAVPLLEAYMKETNPNVLANAELSFERLLRVPSAVLQTFASELARHLTEADALHRKVVVGIVGRLLEIHGDQFEAGGWRSAHLRGMLMRIVLEDTDAPVVVQAISCLAWSEHPATLETFAGSLEATEDVNRWRRVVDSIVNYIVALERPGRPGGGWVETEGEFSLNISLGDPGKHRPELYKPLLEFVAKNTDQDLGDYAIGALGQTESGKFALQRFMPSLFEAGRQNDIIRIADATSRKIPVFAVNAYWWRGQGHEYLGDHHEAIADYDRVLKLAPQFVEAYRGRAAMRNLVGDYDGALDDFSAVINLEPNDLDALVKRAFLLQKSNRQLEALTDIDAALAISPVWNLYHLKAVSLLNLGRNQDAVDAETRGIELNDQIAEMWLMRGIAYIRLEDTVHAIEDLERARALDPADGRIQENLQFLFEQTNPNTE